jgi:hypothetical protein
LARSFRWCTLWASVHTSQLAPSSHTPFCRASSRGGVTGLMSPGQGPPPPERGVTKRHGRTAGLLARAARAAGRVVGLPVDPLHPARRGCVGHRRNLRGPGRRPAEPVGKPFPLARPRLHVPASPVANRLRSGSPRRLATRVDGRGLVGCGVGSRRARPPAFPRSGATRALLARRLLDRSGAPYETGGCSANNWRGLHAPWRC